MRPAPRPPRKLPGPVCQHGCEDPCSRCRRYDLCLYGFLAFWMAVFTGMFVGGLLKLTGVL